MNTASKPSGLPILPGYNNAAAPSYPVQAGGPPRISPSAPPQPNMNQMGPTSSYGKPQGFMGQPQMPPQQYGQPQPQYGAPQAQYGAPPQQYGQPQAYGAPPQQGMMGQPPVNQYGPPQGQGMMGQPPANQYGGYNQAPNQYGSQPGMNAQGMMQPKMGMPSQGMMPPGANMGYGAGPVSLQKGGNMSLSKAAPGLARSSVGLGWDVRQTPGAPFDLDASCFMLGASDKVRCPQDFIFYNNKQSMDGSILHQGDNLTGAGEGDDEVINVNLAQIPMDIQKIVFVVSIYEAEQRMQNFGMVQRAFIRVVNTDNQQEIVRFDLTEEASLLNCMIFGELYRYNNEWKFRAVGQGVQGGLRQVGAQFGMSLA